MCQVKAISHFTIDTLTDRECKNKQSNGGTIMKLQRGEANVKKRRSVFSMPRTLECKR